MIKVVIIDDEPLARSIVVEYLQTYPNIEVMQECNDGFEGMKAISQHQCGSDLKLLELQDQTNNDDLLAEKLKNELGLSWTKLPLPMALLEFL